MEQSPLFDLSEYEADIEIEIVPDALVVHMGEDNAKIIVAALGGLNIFVPSTRDGREYQRLVGVLGEDLAHKLIDVFGGEFLYIPRQYREGVQKKHRQISDRCRELVRSGKSKTRAIQQTALEYKMTERHIRRLLGPSKR